MIIAILYKAGRSRPYSSLKICDQINGRFSREGRRNAQRNLTMNDSYSNGSNRYRDKIPCPNIRVTVRKLFVFRRVPTN